MKKFVLIYRSPAEAMGKMKTSSPEEMQAEQKKWMDWFAKLGDDLLEMGEMFAQSTRLSSSGFSEPDSNITGFSIIQANNFEAAKTLVEDHPHVHWFDGCTVDVYEPMDMGQH